VLSIEDRIFYLAWLRRIMQGIVKNATVKRFPRIFIYGVPGIGKTTFAAQFPAPVFICTEDGAGELDIDRFSIVSNLDQFDTYLEKVRTEEHSYRTLVIDSVDWLQGLIFDKVAEDAGKTSFSEIGYGKGFEAAVEEISKITDKLDSIMYTRSMTIVLVGHTTVKTYNNPNGENYDRYQPDLHPKVMAPLVEWADLVGFVNYDTYTKKDASGDVKAQGSGTRTLYVEERPAYVAKNRYHIGEPLDFEVAKLGKAIADGKKKNVLHLTPPTGTVTEATNN
jgi:phage nucleotide-binding protein